MNINQISCGQFTVELASKAPTPGGGGAAALVGAVGVALATMVGNYTLGKKTYAAVEEEVKTLMERAEVLRIQLLEQVEADAAAFAPLSKAYGIPKDDPTREQVMEDCLRQAAQPPMEMVRLTCQAIEIHQEMLEKGSRMMVSDVGTGVILCQSALYGAGLNVKVNTKSMTDRAYADQLNREVDQLIQTYGVMAQEIYQTVVERFS